MKTSFLDCPIFENINYEVMVDMRIAIHNPASIDVIGADIAVPDKNF